MIIIQYIHQSIINSSRTFYRNKALIIKLQTFWEQLKFSLFLKWGCTVLSYKFKKYPVFMSSGSSFFQMKLPSPDITSSLLPLHSCHRHLVPNTDTTLTVIVHDLNVLGSAAYFQWDWLVYRSIWCWWHKAGTRCWNNKTLFIILHVIICSKLPNMWELTALWIELQFCPMHFSNKWAN